MFSYINCEARTRTKPGLGPRFQGSARCGSRTPRSTSEGHTLVLSRMARTRRKPRLGPLRNPWKAKHGVTTLDLSAAGRSGGRGETRRRQGRQGDRKTDERGRRVGDGGNYGGCFLFLPFWGTPKDMDLCNAYV